LGEVEGRVALGGGTKVRRGAQVRITNRPRGVDHGQQGQCRDYGVEKRKFTVKKKAALREKKDLKRGLLLQDHRSFFTFQGPRLMPAGKKKKPQKKSKKKETNFSRPKGSKPAS